MRHYERYPRAEHSKRPTITELQEKILQHALRDLEPDRPMGAITAEVYAEKALKDVSEMSKLIHRWIEMHRAEKGL